MTVPVSGRHVAPGTHHGDREAARHLGDARKGRPYTGTTSSTRTWGANAVRAEGKTERAILRALKTYVLREIYTVMRNASTTTQPRLGVALAA